MARFVPVFMWLAACGFNTTMGAHDAAVDDAAGDAPEIDAPEVDALDLCIGTGVNEVCLVALPTQPIEYVSDATIDTSVATNCTPTTNAAAAGWCVIAGTNMVVLNGTIIRLLGSKPVVFATTGGMMIGGLLDASSRGVGIGAGFDPTLCSGGTNATEGNSSGGGFGGSFGGRGANGESADGGFGGISPAAIGSAPTLRGGCAGGPGGPINGIRASGGEGGGGLALLSRTMIQVNGILNASGGGGRVGGLGRQGSGGGGSGGMIVLDAPVINATGASIFANGGGGGEGNDLVNIGLAGTEPLAASQAGTGGSGTSSGGDGGAGSLGGNGGAPPMNASSANAGGGGGGGGAGVIHTTAPLTGATVSPAPT